MTVKSQAEPRGFDVTVETVVGRVTFGKSDEIAPVAAFKMIGEHAAAHLSPFKPSVYRFPGPDDGDTITVTVGIENERTDG